MEGWGVPYRVMKVEAGHWEEVAEAVTALDAIAVGEAVVQRGFAAVFIHPPIGAERIPLSEFKARMHDRA
jgi:hypothetical protein